jgi:hypothetical protein
LFPPQIIFSNHYGLKLTVHIIADHQRKELEIPLIKSELSVNRNCRRRHKKPAPSGTVSIFIVPFSA